MYLAICSGFDFVIDGFNRFGIVLGGFDFQWNLPQKDNARVWYPVVARLAVHSVSVSVSIFVVHHL